MKEVRITGYKAPIEPFYCQVRKQKRFDRVSNIFSNWNHKMLGFEPYPARILYYNPRKPDDKTMIKIEVGLV